MANGQDMLAQALMQQDLRPQGQISALPGAQLAQVLSGPGGMPQGQPAEQSSGGVDLGRLFQDPGVQQALLSFGTNLMQPRQPGQTAAGQIGQSTALAGQALQQQEERERAQRAAEREGEMQERQLGLQEERVGYEGERLGLAREQAGREAEQQEFERELSRGQFESERDYRAALAEQARSRAQQFRRQAESAGLDQGNISSTFADARQLARLRVQQGEFDNINEAMLSTYQELERGQVNPDEWLADRLAEVEEDILLADRPEQKQQATDRAYRIAENLRSGNWGQARDAEQEGQGGQGGQGGQEPQEPQRERPEDNGDSARREDTPSAPTRQQLENASRGDDIMVGGERYQYVAPAGEGRHYLRDRSGNIRPYRISGD